MAKLTAAKRKKIPSKEFGESGDRKYPMPDRAHAINAKARARQQLEAGKLSQDDFEKISAKADRLLYG